MSRAGPSAEWVRRKVRETASQAAKLLGPPFYSSTRRGRQCLARHSPDGPGVGCSRAEGRRVTEGFVPIRDARARRDVPEALRPRPSEAEGRVMAGTQGFEPR